MKLIGLILLPIYTDQLTTVQFGMWSLLEVTGQVLVISFGLRLSTAMIRFYSDAKSDQARKQIVSTAMVASIISILVFNAGAHPFTADLSVLFFDTPEFNDYFTFLIVWTSFEILNRIVLDLIRIKEKPLFYITLTIAKFLIILTLNIYFIAVLHMGIMGIILGQLIGSLFGFVVALPFLIKEMRWSVDLSLLREMIAYGFPLIFSGISAFILNVGDRYLVKIFLDYDDVGIYSLSYKISSVLKMVLVQAFQLGFLPIAFNMFNKPEAPRFFSKVFTYYTFLLFWSSLVIGLFSREIIILFSSDESYYSAYHFVPLLVTAISFFGIQNFFIIGLHYAKKTRQVALITLIVLIFSLLLNTILIPRIGLYGAAITAILSGLLMILMSYMQSQKFYPIRYEIRKVIIIIAVFAAILGSNFLLNRWPVGWTIPIKILLVLIYPALLYLFRFYDPVEIESLRGLWRKWRSPMNWYRNLGELLRKQSFDSTDM